MAERKTKFETGGYYHAYNRGCNKGTIFRDKRNFNYLIGRLAEGIRKCKVSVIAYCLMPNHYHLLLRQDAEIGIDVLLQSVFTSYVKAFNKAQSRTGTLFEGPFQAKHVDSEDYLFHLCRYIHRNPVDSGLVISPSDWEFSNYQEWIEKRHGALVDLSFVRSHFTSPTDYEKFVMNYEPTPKIDVALKRFLFD